MLEQLIDEGAALKEEIAAKNARLREITNILFTSATFPDGKNTTHLIGCNHKATIQRKETIAWDQEQLNAARSDLGDDVFFNVFGWEFKPKAKKDLDGFLSFHPKSDLIRQAMTIKQAAPGLTFAALEG